MSLDQGRVIATIKRNDREELRVALSTFKGKTRCDVRIWYRDGEQFLPGKGVSILPEHLPAVLKGLSSACHELGIAS
jgi:hypothetical protein